MKKITYFLLSFILTGLFSTGLHAAPEDKINREDTFIFLSNAVSKDIPESYQYIDLKFNDISEWSKLEIALQKLVYLNLIKNVEVSVQPSVAVNLYTFELLAKKILWLEISGSGTMSSKKQQYLLEKDLKSLENSLTSTPIEWKVSVTETPKNSSNSVLWDKEAIFNDVYSTLKNWFYDRSSLEDEALVNGAIKWLASWAWDIYTSYFPSVESTDFFSWLNGEFEWIGAYVEMNEPGILLIVSPVVDSPAEKAGIKAWDIVTQVDGKKVTPNNTLGEVVSWIKGPSGTTTTITILRWKEGLVKTFTVKREKITINNVDYRKQNSDTFYIQIKTFGDNVEREFNKAAENIWNDTSIKNIIIDVRNNPGGYLDEASLILSYFVPKWEPTAIVSNGTKDTKYVSLWFEIIDASQYNIIILQNAGSASASEILVWTLKDYFPKTVIIWEKSFWKGSVQSLKTYQDGSTLKYTTAKWFTGKTRKWIDHVWISPDVNLEYDIDMFKTQWIDNQLEEALKY